nr:carbamoyltransferase HypF [Pseudomonadota bacterium]
CTRGGFRRAGHLRTFRLPGGGQAVREPRRAALGVLHALFGTGFADSGAACLDAFAPAERAVLGQMLDRGVNSPLTSSAGRLFDAAASLLGLRQTAGFEGQAAMAVQFAAEAADAKDHYPFALREADSAVVVDWGPLVRAMLDDLRQGRPAPVIARMFHNTLAEAILAVAGALGETRIVLAGGCFQNRLLLELTVPHLRRAGLGVWWPQQVPPNDAGIALGQAAAACARRQEDIPCA